MSESAGVVLRECPPRGCLNLRGDATDERFRDAARGAIGVALPVEPCGWRGADETRAYWLGPDEWLVVVAEGAVSECEGRLRQSFQGRFSVADVTGGHVLVSLSGPNAGRVLQKSSPYDFHPRVFLPGRCAQTVFAKATALVAADADGTFDLVIRRSYRDYVLRWIEDAGDEYGYRFDRLVD